MKKQLINERVGAASLRIPNLDNPKAIGYIYTIQNLTLSPTWIRPKNYDSVQKTPLIPCGCFAIRRDLFMSVGGFDKLRKWSCEDFELSLRLWRLGHDLTTSPVVGICHHFKTSETRGFESKWDEVAYNSLRSAIILLSPIGTNADQSIYVCTKFRSKHFADLHICRCRNSIVIFSIDGDYGVEFDPEIIR